MLMQAGQLFP